jgi:thioredoxin 1
LYEWEAATQTAGKVPGLVVPGTASRLEPRDGFPKFNIPLSPAAGRTARRPPFPQENFVSDKVIHATDADFDAAVLQSSEPVLVDFWAPWCGPCKMIAPALDELAETYAGKAKIVKVDVDQNQATAIKYHVRSIPMLLVFKDGQVHGTQIGAVGKAQLGQLIERAL